MPYIYKMSNAGGMSTVTRYTDMLAGNAAFVDTAYESIATVTVGAGGSSGMSFTSIPQTYKHLQIRVFGKTNSNGAASLYMNNVSSGTAYSYHNLRGDGSSTSAYAASSQPYMSDIVGTTSSTNFGGYIIDILDYADTNKYKTIRALNGVDNNGSGNVELYSGLWQSTAAITQFDLFNGYVWSQYTHGALYGIKG